MNIYEVMGESSVHCYLAGLDATFVSDPSSSSLLCMCEQ